jgi:hypothetical protein
LIGFEDSCGVNGEQQTHHSGWGIIANGIIQGRPALPILLGNRLTTLVRIQMQKEMDDFFGSLEATGIVQGQPSLFFLRGQGVRVGLNQGFHDGRTWAPTITSVMQGRPSVPARILGIIGMGVA